MSAKKKEKRARTTITLPESLLEKIRGKAEANRRTISAQIEEDLERQAEAERKQGK